MKTIGDEFAAAGKPIDDGERYLLS
jgi:hypothetical protein